MDDPDIAQRPTIVVFDTTLRDGEQSPGATLNIEEKIEIARQLARLGVDVCEAGFPIASPGDFDAVQRVSREIGTLTQGRQSGQPMTIAGLARASRPDVLRAYEAVARCPPAPHPHFPRHERHPSRAQAQDQPGRMPATHRRCRRLCPLAVRGRGILAGRCRPL